MSNLYPKTSSEVVERPNSKDVETSITSIEQSLTDVNNAITTLGHKACVVNADKRNLWIAVWVNNMRYDKGFILIQGNMNGTPVVAMLMYTKGSGYTRYLMGDTATLALVESYTEENGQKLMLHLALQSFSVISLDGVDPYTWVLTN